MRKGVSEIVVTRHNTGDPEAQVVDNETGEEVVAIVSADSVVTLDGYQVKITEIDIDEEIEEYLVTVDDDKAYEAIVEEMAGLGIPLDKEVVSLVIDAYHQHLESLGLAQWEADQEDDD